MTDGADDDDDDDDDDDSLSKLSYCKLEVQSRHQPRTATAMALSACRRETDRQRDRQTDKRTNDNHDESKLRCFAQTVTRR